MRSLNNLPRTSHQRKQFTTMPKTVRRPTNYLATLPAELLKEVWSYTKASWLQELQLSVSTKTLLNNTPSYYRNLGSDPIRCKYLNDTYREIAKVGKGRTRELDWWKLIIDLERPIVWHTCILGWSEWFVRRYQVYAKDIGQGGIQWHSIYEPGKLTLAGWLRLTNPKTCYDTRAPVWPVNSPYLKNLAKQYRTK